MAKKPGVMIYFETGQAIKGLDYETKGRLFEAIMEYAEFGTIPPMDGILAAVWPFVANSIDRDAARYEELVEKRRKAGQASAAKKQAVADNGQQSSTSVGTSQHVLANVNTGQHIQPTPTPTPTSTTTPTSTPTATPARATTSGVENSPRAYGLYWNVVLTDDEYLELQAEIPNLQNEVNKLSEYMKRTGKHYDSHAATIRKWAREDAEKEAKQKAQARRNSGNVFLDIVEGGALE